jgi:hypothetical protein
MMQDGCYVNLGEPLISQKDQSMEMYKLKRRDFLQRLAVVGLTDSTRSAGKPYTWGSGQQLGDRLSTVCLMNTQRFINRCIANLI